MSAMGDTFSLDGLELPCQSGQTILEAVVAAGRSVPHLCWHPGLGQSGACRLCTVRVDGQLGAACTTRVRPGSEVECRTEDLDARRRLLLQMLFVEGNHFCPGCEKSGGCALHSAAYEVGMTGPHFEEFFRDRPVDASHPDVWLDLNRCILCKLCVRASNEVDAKGVFAIAGHGIDARVIVDSPTGRLGDSRLASTDLAARICPVGAILPKRRGFAVPIGQRPADLQRGATPAHVRALAETQRQDDRG